MERRLLFLWLVMAGLLVLVITGFQSSADQAATLGSIGVIAVVGIVSWLVMLLSDTQPQTPISNWLIVAVTGTMAMVLILLATSIYASQTHSQQLFSSLLVILGIINIAIGLWLLFSNQFQRWAENLHRGGP